MSYNYKELRPFIFTEQGQIELLKIRDKAFELCSTAGAFSSDHMFVLAQTTWHALACLDRLCELGELIELTPPTVAGQDRVFVRRETNY